MTELEKKQIHDNAQFLGFILDEYGSELRTLVNAAHARGAITVEQRKRFFRSGLQVLRDFSASQAYFLTELFFSEWIAKTAEEVEAICENDVTVITHKVEG